MGQSAYEKKRWKIWKFALGGAVISTVTYLTHLNSEKSFYQSMYFNNAERFLQVIGYILSGILVALSIVAVQNVWVWHSSGNRRMGKPHAILAAVFVSLALLIVATLDPYALV